MKKSTIISSRTLARIHSVVQFRRSCCVENSMMRSYLLFFTKIPSSASEIGTESLRRECEFTEKKWKDAEQKYSSEAERLKALINKMRGTSTWIECRSYCACSLMFSRCTSRLLAYIFLLCIWLALFLCDVFKLVLQFLFTTAVYWYCFPFWNEMPCLYGNYSFQTFRAKIRAF